MDWLPVTMNLRRRDGRLASATKSQLARLRQESGGACWPLRPAQCPSRASQHLTGQPFDVEHAEQDVPGVDLWFLLLAREPVLPVRAPAAPGA